MSLFKAAICILFQGIFVFFQGSQTVASGSLAYNRFLGNMDHNMYASPAAYHYRAFVYGSTIRNHVGLQPYTNNLQLNFLRTRDVAQDLCLSAPTGFTYGMDGSGCRAYWICMNSYSVGSCCAPGTRYVEGMGCLLGLPCNDPCPPI